MFIRVRPSKDVLATGTGTRRRTFSAAGHRHTLEFGKEPIYLELDTIPAELGQDPHLLIRQVTPDEMHAAAGTLTPLPSSAQPEPAAIIAEPDSGAGEELDLKSERLQEPAASTVEPGTGAPAPEPAASAAPPSAEGAPSFSPGHRPGPPAPPARPRPAKAKK